MEEKKKSARTATAVATTQLFPKLFPPLNGSENFTWTGSKFCAEAGSGGACAAPRAALHLRAGLGAGDAAAGARGHWRPPGGPGAGGAQGPTSFYSTSLTASCHRSRSPVGTARDPWRPRWRRSNLRALRAAPTPPPRAWRRPLPPAIEGRDPRPHSPPWTREPLSVPTCFGGAAQELPPTPPLPSPRV